MTFLESPPAPERLNRPQWPSLLWASALALAACSGSSDTPTPGESPTPTHPAATLTQAPGTSPQETATAPDMTATAPPSTGTPAPEGTGTPAPGTPTAGQPTATPTAMSTTLYERLGEEAGITQVITDFLTRVVSDPKINGYFLNSSVNQAHLKGCLVTQVADLAGGPQDYATSGCKDMLTAHQGMGISTNDYNDLAGHLVGALTTAGVAQADIATLASVVTDPGFVDDIVEDPDNNKTIYQRVGRKPAIQGVVNDFVGRVVDDPKINGYFLNDSLDDQRLKLCLVRQVCSLDGPCKYGEGIEEQLNDTPCRDMAATHDGLGISTQDFDDLVTHLVNSLTDAGVASADIEAIGGILTSQAMKDDIIEDLDNDDTVYQRVGRKPAIAVVIADLLARVGNDPSINGFFSSADGARLSTCLIRQICSLDGPCVYGHGVEPELNGVACKGMSDVHDGLTNPPEGGESSRGISIDDFNDLVGHANDALLTAGVADVDRQAVVDALDGMCTDIVDNPLDCIIEL